MPWSRPGPRAAEGVASGTTRDPVSETSPQEEALAQAEALLEELEPVNRAQAQMSSRATAWAAAGVGVILAIAGIESSLSFLRGSASMRAPWMPVWGALLMASISVYLWRRPSATLRVGLVLCALVTASFLLAVFMNGAMAAFGVAMAVAFVHILVPPNIALGACLLVVGASALTVFSSASGVTPAVAVRLVAASFIALLILQFLSRQNRRLSQAAERVTTRLRTMAEGMAGELRLTREERDIAARTDPQTGLLNARAFEESLDQDLRGRRQDDSLVLVSIRLERLDEFIAVLVPSERHIFLDLLVARLAEAPDLVRTGRLSKWEFAVLLDPAASGADLAQLVSAYGARLFQPITFGSRTVPLEPRVGVARWPGDGHAASELLRRADIALVMATDMGSTAPVWFEFRMEAVVTDRALMSRAIDRALRDGEFELYYQPIVSVRGEPLRKAEALIRWNDPVKGQVQPADFIALAESYRKIVPLTHWVLQHAAAQVRAWRQDLDPDFQVSVNMPPSFLEWCAAHPAQALEALTALDAPVGGLVLEITEGAFLNVTAEILQVLGLLKGMGFQVALDDFGIGYSCFAQLDRLPLDILKIDKSLVDHIESVPAKRAVCAAVIRIAHELLFQVVAEGVETAGQQALLTQAGCDFLQGRLFAGPMGAMEFGEFAGRSAGGAA